MEGEILLNCYNSSGAEASKVGVAPSVFGVTANASVVHSVVRWQRAGRRAGTHATLNRAKMEGGGKKPWKQKGTGRARAGSSNSPLWVGGAVTFGPQPRSYAFKLPKKVRRQALFSVLSDRASSGSIVVLDDLSGSVNTGKTKDFASMLQNLKLANKGRIESGRLMFIYSPEESTVQIAARNIEGVESLRVDGVNVYDILRCKKILISQSTLQKLEADLTAKV